MNIHMNVHIYALFGPSRHESPDTYLIGVRVKKIMLSNKLATNIYSWTYILSVERLIEWMPLGFARVIWYLQSSFPGYQSSRQAVRQPVRPQLLPALVALLILISFPPSFAWWRRRRPELSEDWAGREETFSSFCYFPQGSPMQWSAAAAARVARGSLL